ncbi:MAG: glycogen synthase GlgA [Candidatus Omnitrophota bacterium]
MTTVAFCCSEAVPFAKTGGMADVCGTLPAELTEQGVETLIFLPFYRQIRDEHAGAEEVLPGVFRLQQKNAPDIYLIDQPEYFDREGLYGDINGDYPDNLERFDFFCRRSLEAMRDLKLGVDIVHCHDWQTGLIPVYLNYQYADDPVLGTIRSVLTIHNLAYQGLFPKEYFGKLPFADNVLQKAGFYFYGKLSLLRAGIVSADHVTTVSPRYAQEIRTEEKGCGMHDVLADRGDSLSGILNGLDYGFWDPEHDGLIKQRFSAQTPEGKTVNKKELQLLSGLPPRADVPVFGFVGRLSHQKGIDLLADSVSSLMENDAQLIMLGVGDRDAQDKVLQIADRFPNKAAAHVAFDEDLAHQVYAGSDFFLMPSVFEPCGLSQMISMAYGTLPIVYQTGGLADTVIDVRDDGNGLVFDEYSREAFVSTLNRAVDMYTGHSGMDEAVSQAFASRFPWETAAEQYRDLYRTLQTV